MVITNQGVAIQPCFQQAKHMQFYKIGYWVVFIKLGQNMHQRAGLNLPSSKPSGRSWSKHCPSGSGSRNWSSFTCSQYCSLAGSPSFTPWSTTQANKHTIKTQKIKDLSLSSNRKHLRYGVRGNIFEWFPNGMAETGLRGAW